MQRSSPSAQPIPQCSLGLPFSYSPPFKTSLLFRRSKFDDRHQKSPVQEHEAHNQAKLMTRVQQASPAWAAPLSAGSFDPNSSDNLRSSVKLEHGTPSVNRCVRSNFGFYSNASIPHLPNRVPCPARIAWLPIAGRCALGDYIPWPNTTNAAKKPRSIR